MPCRTARNAGPLNMAPTNANMIPVKKEDHVHLENLVSFSSITAFSIVEGVLHSYVVVTCCPEAVMWVFLTQILVTLDLFILPFTIFIFRQEFLVFSTA